MQMSQRIRLNWIKPQVLVLCVFISLEKRPNEMVLSHFFIAHEKLNRKKSRMKNTEPEKHYEKSCLSGIQMKLRRMKQEKQEMHPCEMEW